MRTTWQKLRLGDVLERVREPATLSIDLRYREVTVKLWGRGVVQRRVTSGAEIMGGRRFVARTGQLILSRIDARNGAIGVVPPELDGAVVTNDFPLFDVDEARLDTAFLAWLSKTRGFIDLCRVASEGTTNRVRIQEQRFLALEIPLPPLAEQRRIAARIKYLAELVTKVRSLREIVQGERHRLLLSVFNLLTAGAPKRRMGDVAPIVRRPVKVSEELDYPELGIRSFGKGTFHKPALPGIRVGSKKLFEIRPGDLVLNNVFAWEGAVAVAQKEDVGRYGSHRFITCVPYPDMCTSQFLGFYFLTDEGLEKLRRASPGGAGRNRTLGLAALNEIEVPIPPFEGQVWFDGLQQHLSLVKRVQAESSAELDAVVPSILDKAFKGEL